MVTKILPADHLPLGQTFKFYKTWPCCILNYRVSRMQQHGSKYFNPAHPPQPLEDQDSTYIEHGHVASQIKWNYECSNMVVNIMPEDKRSKFNFFNFIKLKEMEYKAPCKYIFSPYTHPRPVGWSKR